MNVTGFTPGATVEIYGPGAFNQGQDAFIATPLATVTADAQGTVAPVLPPPFSAPSFRHSSCYLREPSSGRRVLFVPGGP